MRIPFIFVITIIFIINSLGCLPTANATEFVLPQPGVMVHMSPEANPPILKGLKVYSDDPFKLEFILDPGDENQTKDLKQESERLIKYFLASLTTPEKDLWVNLSPYEKDRIVPQAFGQTEMGRDLLAQDYLLKQLTASLMYPEETIGKHFWKRIYEETEKRFHTTQVPVNTFHKVWIVPEKAEILENVESGTVYVVESRLKVMLESDYLSQSKNSFQYSEKYDWQNKIIREIIIPELEEEVNKNKNFSHLRQIYNSLILATWYKNKIQASLLSNVYSDKNKIAGVSIDNLQEKEKIYQRYLIAFKKGVYNYIKDEPDSPTLITTHSRKYFSGGMTLLNVENTINALNKGNSSATKLRTLIDSIHTVGLVVVLAALNIFADSDIINSVYPLQVQSAALVKVNNSDKAMNVDLDIPEDALNAMDLLEIQSAVSKFQQSDHWKKTLWPGVSRFHSLRRNIKYWNLRFDDYFDDTREAEDFLSFNQLKLEEYVAFMKKVSRKFNVRSKVVLNVFGGLAPLQPFSLAPQATDVVSVGTEVWGGIEDIKEYFRLNKNSDGDGYHAFDSTRYFHEILTDNSTLKGLAGVAILRIIAFMKGEIRGIRYFKFNPDGSKNFMRISDENSQGFTNAVVEFDVNENGKKIRKRYWYVRQFIQEENIGFDNFIKKLPFELLLFLGAPTGLFIKEPTRSAVIKRIFDPARAKLNSVQVIHDKVLPEFDVPGASSPYPIWRNPIMLNQYQLRRMESIGYSEGGDRIYSGSANDLVSSVDDAMVANRGGVDLTSVNNMAIGKNAIKFYLNKEMVQQFQQAPGFIPIIINIKPMNDLRSFLGFEKSVMARP